MELFPKVSIKKSGSSQVLRALEHENQGNQKSLIKRPGLSQVSNPENLKRPGLIIENINYMTLEMPN